MQLKYGFFWLCLHKKKNIPINIHSALQQPINARSSYFKVSAGHREQHDSGNEEVALEDSRLFSERGYQKEKMENGTMLFSTLTAPRNEMFMNDKENFVASQVIYRVHTCKIYSVWDAIGLEKSVSTRKKASDFRDARIRSMKI